MAYLCIENIENLSYLYKIHIFFKSVFFEKNSLKNVHIRTQILTISILALLAGFDDGKLKNETFPNSYRCDIENNLYYHGMAELIRWVQPPKTPLYGEIGPRF